MGKIKELVIDNEDLVKKLAEVKVLVAQLVRSKGCGCCADTETMTTTEEELGRLLDFPKFKDGSGYNFYDRDVN